MTKPVLDTVTSVFHPLRKLKKDERKIMFYADLSFRFCNPFEQAATRYFFLFENLLMSQSKSQVRMKREKRKTPSKRWKLRGDVLLQK